jgi:anti-sigma factor RsiW
MNAIAATDTVLVLYADAQLDPDSTQLLLQQAELDPALKKTLAALRASRMPFRLAASVENLPPLPQPLRREILKQLADYSTAAHSKPRNRDGL